jgi:hypothetical protein
MIANKSQYENSSSAWPFLVIGTAIAFFFGELLIGKIFLYMI